MGIIKDALGQALGANDVKNGFNGPKLPFVNNEKRYNLSPSPNNSSSRYTSGQQLSGSISPRYDSSWSYHYGEQRPPSSQHDRLPSSSRFAATGQLPISSAPSAGYERYQNDHPPSYAIATRPSNTGGQTFQHPWKQSNHDDKRSIYYRPVSSNNLVDGDFQHAASQRFEQQNEFWNDREPGYTRDQAASGRHRFRPIALPQIAVGEGEPFFRGYSDELLQHDICEEDFIGFIDALNVAIVPNPEQVIFQKGANIAGWFLPGAASLGLMAGQFGVGIGAAIGHGSLVNRTLSKANLELFVPRGLEICICKSRDVDAEAGMSSSGSDSVGLSPEERFAAYGGVVAPITTVLPPLEKVGRNDPIAMLGRGIGHRDQQKKASKAQKDMQKGKSEKQNGLDASLKWLMVRQATPGAIEHWQKALQQSEIALQQEQAQANEQRPTR